MALQISPSILTTIICLIAAFYTPNVQAIIVEYPTSGNAAFRLKLGEQPWLALLELPHGVLCSGTIVSPTAVLSAALCLKGVTGPKRGTAYAGNVEYGKPIDFDPLTQNRSIVEYHLYNENNTIIYHFMLVKIDPKWTWSGSVQPIGIIEEERLPKNFKSLCYMSGLGDSWASNGSQVAHAAAVQLEACACSPQGHRLCYDDSGELVVSAGDLGGPVLCDHKPQNKLYGIISEPGQSGFKELQEFYRVPDQASGFEFVGFYVPWIKKTAGDLLSDEEVKAIRQQHEHDFVRPLGVNGLYDIPERLKRKEPEVTTAAAAPAQSGEEEGTGGAGGDGGAAAEESGAEWRRGAALAALLSAGAVRALC